MRFSRFGSITAALLALAASALPTHAATESVLYSFQHSCCDFPTGRLYFMNGHLFGTGLGDEGSGKYGQVFELKKSGSTWKETTLHFFSGTDGAQPAAGLVQALGPGYLFGTTSSGDAYGAGNVFFLYNTGANWLEGTIWSFGATSGDGLQPYCDLIKDSAGNLYGTTQLGGAYLGGTVFELTVSGVTWTETVLHSFGSGSDGQGPIAGLLIDGSGNLYGTTVFGGTAGNGVVFEMTQSGGVWSETILYSFGSGSDGQFPNGALIKDSKGALYGTTSSGGTSGNGTVFKLFQSGGVWKENVLYNFAGGSDGALPLGGLRWSGGYGALYGTTNLGGRSGCGRPGCGTVFELTQSGGVWSETILHAFKSTGDGIGPAGQVILDKSGNLYGTTTTGGTYDRGTVWEITP